MRVLAATLALAFLLAGHGAASAQQTGQTETLRRPQTPGTTNVPGQYRRAPGDHDRTLDDFREGRIKPFSEIRRRVSRTVGGRIIDADLDRFGSPWIYRVRVLTDDGDVLSVRLNAETGRVIDVKGGKKK